MPYWDTLRAWINQLTANELGVFVVLLGAALTAIGLLLRETAKAIARVYGGPAPRGSLGEPSETAERMRSQHLEIVRGSSPPGDSSPDSASVAAIPQANGPLGSDQRCPNVRPFQYKKLTGGRESLFLVNDSDVRAYQVALQFGFGPYSIHSTNQHGAPFPMIRPHEEFEMGITARAIEHDGAITFEDSVYSALLDWEKAQRKADGIEVPFCLQYHDAANRWFRTECTATRDVLVGLDLKVVDQKVISSQEALLTPVLTAPGESQQAAPPAVGVSLSANLGGTPGLHVRLLSKTAQTLVGVKVVVKNILRWDQELRDWVTSREIHDSGVAFREISWGLVTLHPNAPEAVSFIRAEGNRIEITGHAEGGNYDHRFTTYGLWRLSYEVVIPGHPAIAGHVCFAWHGVALPSDGPDGA